MNSSAQANLHAFLISSSGAFSLPHNKFSLIEPVKRTFFCKTTETASLSVFISYSFTFLSPIYIFPLVASYNLGIKDIRVLFELPVPPSIPIVSPDFIVKFISFKQSFEMSFE